MNENYIGIEPYGLEATIKALPDPHLNDGLKQVPSLQTQKVESTEYKPLPQGLMDNIFKPSVQKEDPYASKFQDAALSKRYEGRNVFYGDYKLDPKLLDARYSKTQSWSEQSLNSLKVGLANGGAMFASSILAVPDLIYNIAATDGDITNSALNKTLFDWTRSINENNITFENEQDQKTDAWNTIKNIILPSAISGSSKGWGATFENAMFGVGAGLGTYVTGGLGVAGVARIPSLATSVAKALNNVNSIRKYGEMADKIIDTSVALQKATTALNNTYKLKDIAKWGYRSSIGAYGEAAFEAQESIHSLKQNLTNKFTQEKGYAPTGEDLKKIDTIASEGGKARFWANMALLMGSNTLQNRRLFRSFDLARESTEQLAKQGLNVSLDATGKAVARKNFELKSDWWNKGFQSKLKKPIESVGNSGTGALLLESTSEGLEEFSQGWIDKAVNDYSMWKLDHRGQPSIDQALNSIQQGFRESWNNEGLKSLVSGMFSGIAQQAVFAGVGKGYTAAVNPEQLKLKESQQEALQRTLTQYDGFNINDFASSVNINSVRNSVDGRAKNLNAQGVIDDVAEGAVQNGDKKLYKDMESISFFSLAEPYVSKGHGNILKEQFDFSLDKMSDQQVQELFNSDLPADVIKSRFKNQVDEVNNSFNKIKQSFRNPYSYTGDVREQSRYNIFETEFIPQLAYLDYRLKDLNKRRADIQNDLGELYSELKYSTDIADVKRNRSYIEEQIESLKETKEYLSSLDSPILNEEFNKSKYLVDQYTKSLESLSEFEKDQTEDNYRNFMDNYYEAALSKLGRDKNGMFDKEQVLQNLSDHNRINLDLLTVEKMIKSYLSQDGEDLFISSFSALAQREDRKRELFSRKEEFKTIKPELIEQFPEFTEEEIDDVLLKSASSEQAVKTLEETKLKKLEDAKVIEDIKTKIREKFVNAGRGDLADNYINETSIKADDKLKAFKDADEYLKNINNDEFKDYKSNLVNQLVSTLKSINENFEGMDTQVYSTLSEENKIKYHQAVIDYYTKIKEYKDLPKTFKDQQDKLISEQQEILKELQKEKVEEFHKQIGNYHISKDGEQYVVSLNDTQVEKFNTIDEAETFISEELTKELIRNDVKAELINNIENKFENGSYNPEVFDKDGNRIIRQEDNKRTELFHKIADGRSEQEISDLISSNLIIDSYSLEDKEGSTQIFDRADSGQLPQELILRSVTTDAVTLSYNDPELGVVRLATYKNYKTGLGFMSNLKDILENPEKYKMEKTITVPKAVASKSKSTKTKIIQTNTPTIQTINNITFGTANKQNTKEDNEDAVYVDVENGIFILADGMGGENSPLVSSSETSLLTINKLLNKEYRTKLDEFTEFVESNPKATQDEVLSKFGTKYGNNGVTQLWLSVLNKEDLINKKGFRTGATALKATKINRNTYNIEKVGDTVFFVVDKNNKIIQQHGLSNVTSTQGYMLSVKDGKSFMSTPKTDNFTITLNKDETLVLATDFIETDKAIQDFINSSFGKNIDFKEFQKNNKSDDSTFITIKYDERAQQDNSPDIDKVVNFIGNSDYYGFLEKSTVDPTVYKILQDNGFLQFKGTPQEQLNLINDKQKVWDYLNTESLENIKNNIEFKREFYAMNFNRSEVGTQEFNQIVHPFANLDGYNMPTFFYVPNDYSPSQSSEAKVDFIGLPQKYRKTAKEKIQQSFTRKTNEGSTVSSGNYMLLSDSTGNPMVHRLANKKLNNTDFLRLFNENSKQVMVMPSSKNLTIKYDVDKEQFSVRDNTDDYYLYVKHPIKTEEDVKNIIPRLYAAIAKKDKWFEDSKKGNATKQKALSVNSLALSLVKTPTQKPNSVEEILETRVVTGIAAKNFHVDKIVPSFKTQPVKGVTIQKVEEPVAPVVTGDIYSTFEQYKTKLPNTITFDDVVKVSGENSNLATAIILGAVERRIKENTPIYINDLENIEVSELEKISLQPSRIIAFTFKKSNFAKLFTTKVPYKTHISTEQRVQDLLKTCFR